MDFNGFDENFSLAGKVAMITGAGAGIGEAIALMFARKGADVVLLDVNEAACKKVAEKIVGLGRKALAKTVDVTRPDAVRAVVAEAAQAMSHIDILVNSAGVAILDDAENLSDEAWNKTIAVNLSGTYFMAREAGRIMIRQGGGGKIINLASQGGVIALDKHVAYNSTKAGVIAMTKVLAIEWAEFGIQVNAISPTVILTELGKRAWAGEVGEAMKKKIPAGRFGYPEEVAAAAVYLASQAANLVTGSNLVIDGGYSIQ